MKTYLKEEEYKELPVAVFPLVIGGSGDDSIKVEEVSFSCDKCDHDIVSLRVKVIHINDRNVDLLFGGYCCGCGAYDSGKLRYYSEQHDILEFNEEGIIRRNLTPDSLKDHLKLGYNNLVSFFTKKFREDKHGSSKSIRV